MLDAAREAMGFGQESRKAMRAYDAWSRTNLL